MDTWQTTAGARRAPLLTIGNDVPAHPALTDIPVATFTLAPIFDASALLTDSDTLGGAGLWSGIAGAVWSLPAVATGALDWLHAGPGSEVRRLGTRHAVLNVTALGLVIGSLVARAFRARPTVLSTALSATAGGIVTYSSHVGEIMSYQQGSRVKPAETFVEEAAPSRDEGGGVTPAARRRRDPGGATAA